MKDPLNAVWMETYSGLAIVPAYPEAEIILIRDIAHHLSQICRFNGACREFYSVAQHSVMVAQQLPKELQLEGLLHDAAEAYTGDITSPMKKLLDSAMLDAVEWKINNILVYKFKLEINFADNPQVKDADIVMLKSEAKELMKTQGYAWDLYPGWDRLKCVPIEVCWNPSLAEGNFLRMYRRLRRDQ